MAISGYSNAALGATSSNNFGQGLCGVLVSKIPVLGATGALSAAINRIRWGGYRGDGGVCPFITTRQ